MKDNILKSVEELISSIKSLEGLVRLNKGEFISKSSIKDLAKNIARKWFEEIEPLLKHSFTLDDTLLQKYHECFDNFLKFSLAANSRKSTYLKCINTILADINTDIVKFILKSGGITPKAHSLYSILNHVSPKEIEYLEEAIKCANLGFKRASIILAWCATIDRIHNVIAKIGFSIFNDKSKEMKNKSEGRYKRFSKSFSIESINEMRATVFDNDLLWILEYMELIDPNQHDRLSLCFTMRNNCGHPGDAPISDENLMSFYSDIDNIILNNHKFKL